MIIGHHNAIITLPFINILVQILFSFRGEPLFLLAIPDGSILKLLWVKGTSGKNEIAEVLINNSQLFVINEYML
jgi:hypothetical protein